MTPTRQPNPALEWRLEAIDRMHPDLLTKFLTSLEDKGIGIGPKGVRIYDLNQLKDLTVTMGAFLQVLDEGGPHDPT